MNRPPLVASLCRRLPTRWNARTLFAGALVIAWPLSAPSPGKNLTGQVGSTLSLANVQLANAGDYDAVITDGQGSVTSQVAHLEFDPAFTKITTGRLVAGFGCAWGDYDGDGLIDQWKDGNHDFLFHNKGGGIFDRITSVPQIQVNANSMGAA